MHLADVDGRPLSRRGLDLRRLFEPSTVAVIGASDTPGKPNTGIWQRLVTWGAARGATVVPVNPGRDAVDGRPCARTIADVPGADLAVLLVGDVLPVMKEVVAAEVPFAVVFASGFAETGDAGRAAQEELRQLLAGSRTHLLGPNTNLNLFEEFRTDLPGKRLALVTQSGHQGRPIFQGQELGIAMSHWAPTGNEVDLEFADFAAWFADQSDVGVIAAYIEGFKDGRTLHLAAEHAASRGVPIVCVKVGRTSEGSAMAQSHTGKLTGSDAVVDGAFRQFGVTRVDGLDELLDTAQLMARYPAGPAEGGDGVVVYSISGGTGAHMADLCAAAGLRLPTLSPATQRTLHQWIPEYLRVSNPVDNGGHPVGDERGRRILDALVADPDVGVLVCPITGAFPPMSDRLAQDLVDVAETTDKPVCVVWGSPVGTEAAYRDILLSSSRVAVFRTFGNCVRAVKAWVDWHAFRRTHRSPFDGLDIRPGDAADRARSSLAGREAVSEHEAKLILAEYGIPVTAEEVVTSAADAARAARAVGGGRPVVLKVSGAAFAHKSEAGGIRLGVVGDAEVRRAYEELAELSGGEVLVAELVDDGVAEMVVGISRDPVFGPVVMAGLGGVFVEVLGDVTFRVPPFDADEARRMVRDLAAAKVLAGVRGRPPADEDALVDVLVRVQRMARELNGTVDELDINPLVLRRAGAGAVALDALVVPARR